MNSLLNDPVSCAVGHLTVAMREAFEPDSEFPPLGGGSTDVRFFAGDGAPLAAWDAHSNDIGCNAPFLWVRLMQRFKTKDFPTPWGGVSNCELPTVAMLEVGVGRCAVVDHEPSWDDYAREAEVSLDDSRRIELVLCRAQALMRASDCSPATATLPIVPFGPEGGVIAWVGTVYVQL